MDYVAVRNLSTSHGLVRKGASVAWMETMELNRLIERGLVTARQVALSDTDSCKTEKAMESNDDPCTQQETEESENGILGLNAEDNIITPQQPKQSRKKR